MSGRISEGGAARLSALGVVAVLLGIVGAALAGRPAAPPPRPTADAVAPFVRAATPAPTQAPTASPLTFRWDGYDWTKPASARQDVAGATATPIPRSYWRKACMWCGPVTR